MKRSLLFFFALIFCAVSFAAEISGFGYRITSDNTGTRIYYRGQLLQCNAWSTIVEGPGWKRSLLDNKAQRKAEIAVKDGALTVKLSGIDTTAYHTYTISENGVAISMRYETKAAEINNAELWFGALPTEKFAECEFTVKNGKKTFVLPTTHDKDAEKKSKWRISPDVLGAYITCDTGVLEITSDKYFHVFDGRFHLAFPANARTFGFRSMQKMVPGETYTYNLKFVENETAKLGNTDYKVTVANKSMSITWRGHQIQGTAWPSIVQGPKHFRGLVDNSNFWKYAKVEQNGAMTIVTSEIDKVKTCLTAEVQQDGVELTFRYDTDVTPISTADLWFGSQRLEDCAGRNCTLGDKSALHVLPPIIERESSPKSRWRLHGDVYKASLYMDYGILDITGESSFHLFDSRYHGYFPAKARAVSARSMSGMVSGQTYRYKLSVREPQVKITPEAANEKQILMLRPMKQAPAIDGKLSAGEWLDASEYKLHGIGNKKITADTFAYAGYDNEYLYFAYRCEDERGLNLLKESKGVYPYDNDCIEIILNTDGEIAYKQIQADIFGRLNVNHQGAKAIYELKNERVTYKTIVDEKGWSIELAIPMKDLGITPDTDWPMSGNITRSRQWGEYPNKKSENSTLAQLEHAFQEMHRMLPIRFAERPNAMPFADKDFQVDLTFGNAWVNASIAPATKDAVGMTVLPRLRYGSEPNMTFKGEKKLNQVDAAPITLSADRSSVATFNFEVSKDDELFYIQVFDASGTYLLASKGPYYFAQNSLSTELAKLEAEIPALAKKLGAADGMKAFSAEVAAVRKEYAAAHDEKVTAKAEDLSHTRQRLNILAAQNGAKAYNDHLAYYLTSPLNKIRREEYLPEKLVIGGDLKLSGAGDEVVSAQIVLLPLDRNLSEITPVTSDLRTADGKVIPAANITVYNVKDVALYTKLWPDLLSVDKEALPRNTNQHPVWISIAIPKGTAAGNYTGSIAFNATEGKTVVPVTLTAYGWDLPRVRKAFTWADVNDLSFKNPEDGMRFRKELISRDLFPGGQGVPHPRWFDTYDYTVDESNLMTFEPMNFVCVAMVPWVEWLERFYENGKYKNAEGYYAMIKEKVREGMKKVRAIGAQDVAYIYYDEINVAQKLVKDTLMDMKKEFGLKVMTCFCTPSLGTGKVDYYREMVDYYIFSGNHFTDPMWLEYIEGLRKDGHQVAWYFNMAYPKMPTSNVIDCPGVVNRIQLFQQWKYNVDMSLYWSAHYWLNNDIRKNPPLHKSRGNGMFFYPNDERAWDPSIRSELLRDGCQDYRYLSFLKSLAEQKNSKMDAKLAAEVKDILNVTWIKSITDYPEEPAVIEAQRQRIVDAINKLRAL